MGKHDKDVMFSWDNPNSEFYKERIKTLEMENAKLREELERKANAYSMGKDVFEEHFRVLNAENDELRDRVRRLERALINAEIRDV